MRSRGVRIGRMEIMVFRLDPYSVQVRQTQESIVSVGGTARCLLGQSNRAIVVVCTPAAQLGFPSSRLDSGVKETLTANNHSRCLI